MSHESEIKSGKRFRFGRNWSDFLGELNPEKLRAANKSLRENLSSESLAGKSFLDVGSGSGLFSFCAYELGARVYSFDYDPLSVACAVALRRGCVDGSSRWKIEEGSILDAAFVKSMGQFDIVYSWGVLHHTGDMKTAFENVAGLVNDGGKLYISIYNDQGRVSSRWKVVKQIYCSGVVGRFFISAIFFSYFGFGRLIQALRGGKNPFQSWRAYSLERGMSVVHDWKDWLGGYPFEVAKPELVFDFFKCKGFELDKLKTCGGGLGCNEFVFIKKVAGFFS